MLRIQLVERIDGHWVALIDDPRGDAVAAPTPEEALGRLVRGAPGKFGIAAIEVRPLDPSLAAEPAALDPRADTGPDASAPEVHPLGEGFPGVDPPGSP